MTKLEELQQEYDNLVKKQNLTPEEEANTKILEEKIELYTDRDEDAVNAFIEIVGEDYATGDSFDDSFQGSHLSDENFTMQLLEDTEPELKNLPPYISIDWETTARNIMMDYAEQDGYYFRNI